MPDPEQLHESQFDESLFEAGFDERLREWQNNMPHTASGIPMGPRRVHTQAVRDNFSPEEFEFQEKQDTAEQVLIDFCTRTIQEAHAHGKHQQAIAAVMWKIDSMTHPANDRVKMELIQGIFTTTLDRLPSDKQA